MIERLRLKVPPPIMALVCGLAMWAIARALPAATIEFPFQAVAGFALIGAGLLFDLTSIVAFIRAKTAVTPIAPHKASQLVTGGLYRITRNPMYLGLVLILGGWAIVLGSPLAALCLVPFIAAITALQIKPEEDRLEAIFGEDYRAYKQSVRRWL